MDGAIHRMMVVRAVRTTVLTLLVVASAACGGSDDMSGFPDAAPEVDAPPALRVDAPPSGPAMDAGLLLPADDTFDGMSLDGSWAVHNVERAELDVTGGQLRLAPHANQVWVNAKEGVLVYKLVTGDFKVTTTVHARLTTDLTKPLDHGFQVGGLMARDQNFPPASYVAINAGLGTMDALAVFHESTKASSTMSDESPFGADAQLRICRTGSTFSLLKRAPGDTTWVEELQVTRDDLPMILQVGPDVSSGVGEVNSTFLFDAVDFAPVGAGCTQ